MVISILGLLVPLLLIAGVVYLVVRARGDHGALTVFDALATYIYTIIGASMITISIGVILFIDVALRKGSHGSDEIALASVLVGTGLVVGLPHLLGKGLAERRGQSTFAAVRRVYLFFMLGLASLTGLVSLPLAINALVNHYVVQEFPGEFPHVEMAVAIVAVALWVYYLYRVVRETARGKEAGEADDGGKGT